jgi:hypothetical protein
LWALLLLVVVVVGDFCLVFLSFFGGPFSKGENQDLMPHRITTREEEENKEKRNQEIRKPGSLLCRPRS